jgi:hypothetical protein
MVWTAQMLGWAWAVLGMSRSVHGQCWQWADLGMVWPVQAWVVMGWPGEWMCWAGLGIGWSGLIMCQAGHGLGWAWPGRVIC